MKRLAFRLAALSIVGVLGFFAIAQAQRQPAEPGTEQPETDAAADGQAAADGSAVAGDTVAGDPMAGGLPGVGGAPPDLPATQPLPGIPDNPQRLPIADNLGETNPLRGQDAAAPPAADYQPLPKYQAAPYQPDSRPAPAATLARDLSEPPPAGSARGGRDPLGLAAVGDAASDAPATRDIASLYNNAAESQPAADLARGANQLATRAKDLTSRAADGVRDLATRAGDALARSEDPTRPLGSSPETAPAGAIDGRDRFDVGGPRPEGGANLLAPPATRRDDFSRDRLGANDSVPQRFSVAGPPAGLAAGAAPYYGSDRPGSKNLEGPQSPTLTLEKSAPDEIQVGKAAKFSVTVRNTGPIPAEDVQVQDQVPKGTRLLGTNPRAASDGSGALVWSLGTMEPGDEQVLEMQLMPEQEGEIGSVASVTLRTQASVRTVATKPELQLTVTGPREVLIGEQVNFDIKVTNPGTGVASGVVLFNSLPGQLRHSAGPELEFEIGDLAPKESREVALTVTAAGPGQITNLFTARGDGSILAESGADVTIIAPALRVSLDGPKMRYLERQATYTLSVSNPGTAPAKDVELISQLPEGMQFVSANNKGHYDKAKHAVYWSLEELPDGETGSVKLITIPTEAGKHTLRVAGSADLDLSDELEEQILVEGIAALLFEVVDVEDPVEIGGDTVYEIRVLNQGTKTAENIRLVALLPQQLKPLAADGPTRGVIDGNRIGFAALPRLAPKADTTYKIRAQGVAAGDVRIRVHLQSADMKAPVLKEESTRVYPDR